MSEEDAIPASNNDTSSFFGSQPRSFAFENEGDKVRGIVVAKELRNATFENPLSGKTEVARWDDGRPKKIAVVTLKTFPNGEEVALWVRGFMQRDFQDAVRDAGYNDLEIGSDVRVTWEFTDAPSRRGFSGARHYKVELAGPGESLQSQLDEEPGSGRYEPAEETPF
jgi:hypothetical protein